MPRKRHFPNQVDLHVSSRVKLRRLELGMSQESLGTQLRVSLQQVQKYEKARDRLGASRLQQIARALGVPASYFFERLPEHRGDASRSIPMDLMNEFLADRAGMALMRAFCRISDRKVRRQIIQLIHTLSGRGR